MTKNVTFAFINYHKINHRSCNFQIFLEACLRLTSFSMPLHNITYSKSHPCIKLWLDIYVTDNMFGPLQLPMPIYVWYCNSLGIMEQLHLMSQ